MKKALTISVLILTVLACHRKTIPATDNATVVSQDTTMAVMTEPKTEAPKPDAVHASMVAQGKTVYINRCGRCHELKKPESFSAQRWEGILKSMIPKARLNETEGQQVTAYVMENAKK